MSAKDILGLTRQEHAHGFLAAKRHGLSLLWYIQTLVIQTDEASVGQSY